MKLYTEADLKRAMKRAYLGGMTPFNLLQVRTEILEQLTPIELPSDEEIRKIMELDDMEFDEFDPYHVSHFEGAKWMRDLIQGGNK